MATQGASAALNGLALGGNPPAGTGPPPNPPLAGPVPAPAGTVPACGGIYLAYKFGPLLKWVDDFFAIWLPSETRSEEDFIALTAAAGVPWSAAKTKLLSVRQRYIGFVWDLEHRTVSLPEEKLAAVQQLLASSTAPAATFSAKEAASLHGKLVHISSIFRLIRPFMRSVALFAAEFQSPFARRRPSSAMRRDLEWIAELLGSLPNELPLAQEEPEDVGWWGDASTSFGIGLVIGTHWAVWRWAPGVHVGPGKAFDIGWAEAVAVELGLCIFLQSGVRSALPPAASRILVRSDNDGVVTVVRSGRSRNGNTNQVLKRIYLSLAANSISLVPAFVPSAANFADPLSRGDITAFLKRFPSVTHRITIDIPSHLRQLIVDF